MNLYQVTVTRADGKKFYHTIPAANSPAAKREIKALYAESRTSVRSMTAKLVW